MSGQPCDLVELLDADRHAAERQRHVGAGGGRDRLLAMDVREGVEVAGIDRRERGVELFSGGALAAAEGLDERAGVALPGHVGHGAAT